jgi:hypothetical protein
LFPVFVQTTDEINFGKIDSGIQRAAIVTMRRGFVLNDGVLRGVGRQFGDVDEGGRCQTPAVDGEVEDVEPVIVADDVMELLGLGAAPQVEFRVSNAFLILQGFAHGLAGGIDKETCRALGTVDHIDNRRIPRDQVVAHRRIHVAGRDDAESLGFERMGAGTNAVGCDIVEVAAAARPAYRQPGDPRRRLPPRPAFLERRYQLAVVIQYRAVGTDQDIAVPDQADARRRTLAIPNLPHQRQLGS